MIQCNHKNLEDFQTSKVLALRQVRWSVIYSSYNIFIQHLEGTKNPAHRPSWQLPYEEDYTRPKDWQFKTLVATTVEQISDLLQTIRAAHHTDSQATDLKNMTYPPCWSKASGQDRSTHLDSTMQWEVIMGVLTYIGKIYVQGALHNQVMSLFHDSPETDHCGAPRTAELASRYSNLLGLDTMVWKYVAWYEVCNQITTPCRTWYGVNMPLQPLYHPWDRHTMDFVTDQPELTKLRCTRTVVIVNWLTTMVIYWLCWMDLDSPGGE